MTKELHVLTIHRVNSVMAACSKVSIDWVFAMNALCKGLCMELRAAKSLLLF